jgi:hypothetical protein
MRRLTLKQQLVLDALRAIEQPARPRDLMPLRSQHEAGENDDWPPVSEVWLALAWPRSRCTTRTLSPRAILTLA